jgi:hypothetical protein
MSENSSRRSVGPGKGLGVDQGPLRRRWPADLNLRRSSTFHSGAKRCIVFPLLAYFSNEVFAMSNSVEDSQMLRLIRAFQKLTDQGTRRTVLLYVEEQVQKQPAEATVERSTKSSPGAGNSTTVDS